VLIIIKQTVESSPSKEPTAAAAAGMPSVHKTNPIDRRIPTDSSSSSSSFSKMKFSFKK
jgi:hypothetical protein